MARVVYLNSFRGSAALKIDDDEARRSQRRHMLKAGIVSFGGRQCSIPCAVRDISESGAKLTVSEFHARAGHI